MNECNIQMSNIGRRQLGASEKAFKYQFTLEILRFQGSVPLNCKLKFMWRRNSKSIETKNDIDVRANFPTDIPLIEKLSSISTIIFNTDRREFLPKESELIANMLFNGSPKKLATYAVDMRCILDPNSHRATRSEVFEVEMVKHVNHHACRVTFRLSSVFKEEMVCSERSIGNASLNMSGLSIQAAGYFQKRYDVIPSKDGKEVQSVIAKDTHSVASYNPNRYPSAKRERDDSSSRKFDYGYLAALKSNLIPSDPDGKSHKKSIDNKTENNEGYNRQLADEQNRRSKLEAELSKNSMMLERMRAKIEELTIENTQLKQRMGKEDSGALQHRLYEINNQSMTLKAQLEQASMGLQRMEAEAKAAKTEKAMLQGELLKRQKRLQGLQALQGENNEMKYQMETLRRALDEARRASQERENQLLTDKFREQQQTNGKIEAARRQNQRLRATASSSDLLQKRTVQLEAELKVLREELSTKTRYIIGAERQTQQYKSRLEQYEAERVALQRQLIRLKNQAMERGDRTRMEQDQRIEAQRSEMLRLQEQLTAAQMVAEERLKAVQKTESERAVSEGKVSRLLAQGNETQRRMAELESQCRQLREKQGRLEQANAQLLQETHRLKETQSRPKEAQSGSSFGSSSSPQADKLFRESLQLQVELKFATEQLQRLREVQARYQQERWVAAHERGQRQAAEKQFERVQRELAVKNRALMVQVGKTKMMSEEINQLENSCELMREELQKNRSIIHNGQQQLNAFEANIHHLQNTCAALQAENARLIAERQQLAASSEELRQLQAKVRELEQRNAQKLKSLQASNHNLQLAHRQAKESQRLAEERLMALSNRERQLLEAEAKIRELQTRMGGQEGEVVRACQQRAMLQKRMQVVMEQMHMMKKRYEEQKGRSVSFTRGEDLNRLRSLESELQKKEKAVSKLSKEKLELQEENVKMNVQIMKMYSEIEKYKANPNSLKLISQSNK